MTKINQAEFSDQLQNIMKAHSSKESSVHIEDYISSATLQMLIPLYYAAARIDQAQFQGLGESDERTDIKLPDGTEVEAGGDDSYFDYIPNGLEFLSGLCKIVLATFGEGTSAEELRTELKEIFEEQDFEGQDATPKPVSDMVNLIAQTLED